MFRVCGWVGARSMFLGICVACQQVYGQCVTASGVAVAGPFTRMCVCVHLCPWPRPRLSLINQSLRSSTNSTEHQTYIEKNWGLKWTRSQARRSA